MKHNLTICATDVLINQVAGLKRGGRASGVLGGHYWFHVLVQVWIIWIIFSWLVFVEKKKKKQNIFWFPVTPTPPLPPPPIKHKLYKQL